MPIIKKATAESLLNTKSVSKASLPETHKLLILLSVTVERTCSIMRLVRVSRDAYKLHVCSNSQQCNEVNSRLYFKVISKGRLLWTTILKGKSSPFCALVLLITKEGLQIQKLSKFRIFRTFSNSGLCSSTSI